MLSCIKVITHSAINMMFICDLSVIAEMTHMYELIVIYKNVSPTL